MTNKDISKPTDEPVDPIEDLVIEDAEATSEDVIDQEEKLKADIVGLSADLENLKKNILTEAQDSRRRALEFSIRAMAPAIDALEMALRTMREESQSEELAGWREGIEKVHDRFVQAMLELGVVPVPVDGTYDPKFHESIEQVPGEEYQIMEVTAIGWMWKEDASVIVPAKVHVGTGKE